MKVADIKRVLVGCVGFLLLSITSSAAEVDSVGVETVNGTKFIRHKVEAGENWYSISRRYAIFYTELRLANKESAEVLKVGQVINIPPKAKAGDPRYQKNYTNQESPKEVKKEVATPAVTPVDLPLPLPEKVQPVSLEKNTVKHVVTSGQTVYSISRMYGVKPTDIATWNNLTNFTIAVGQELVIKDAGAPEKTGERIVSERSSTPTTSSDPVSSESNKAEAGTKSISGYVFASGRQDVSEKGFAGCIEEEEINPNKYYALHRTAPIGTVVKVTNKKNGRSVFVKVVGSLPNTPENDGFILKMSKAGADQLWVYDTRFQVELLYGVPSK